MRRILFVTCLALGLTAPAWAEVTFDDLRVADKVSFTLTGLPLSDAERQSFLSGELNLEKLIDQKTKSDEFVERFAQFWMRKLHLLSSIKPYSLRLRNGRNIASAWNAPNRVSFNPSRADTYTTDYLNNLVNRLNNRTRVQLYSDKCRDGNPIIFMRAFRGANFAEIIATERYGDKPIVATKAAWQQVWDLEKAARVTCTQGVKRPVNPVWNPDQTYDVSEWVIERCGARLARCNLLYDPGDDGLANFVDQDIVMEPAYLIGHLVRDDHKFSEVLTTDLTVMTGSYAYFIDQMAKDFWGNFPGGGFDTEMKEAIGRLNPNDRSRYLIKRKGAHAGILTTPSYQLSTNGRRAKANRVYETMLCRSFTVPEGAQPDPSDDNPDLRKRAYCAYCHRSLEPMANFFAKWPKVGNVDYIFQTGDVDDTGAYNGRTGKGPQAFGKFLAQSDSFKECSVRRAFQFVNGRDVTATEKDFLIQSYVTQFNSNNENLREIIKAMLMSSEFTAKR